VTDVKVPTSKIRLWHEARLHQRERSLAEGRLTRVLEDWCAPFSGYRLYCPSRQSSRAFSLMVDALRYRR
jgi:hypothetical protein